ncbi:hypothetical protein BKA64DRAFT_377076 [Cadophora sp. MPI-SDFR-AT-0126]|nr:hypothetical protein BKA64DRAFT_377076 [Leotiomycetes sp. MPI-SDFR-AT-0126]
MILPYFWFWTSFVILLVSHAERIEGQVAPACSVNCTLVSLDRAGCEFTDIPNCLCTNDTLQYDLSLCVFGACNQTEQITASEIFREQLCKDVPYPSRSSEIVRAEIILAAFTFPMIALRLISRVWIAQRVWWDDWMVLFSGTLMIPMSTIPIYTSYHGLGKHIWNIPAENSQQLQLLYFIATIIYVLVQNLAKLSILLLYLRIFPGAKFRVVTKCAIIWQLIHTIIYISILIFQCSPVQSAWHYTLDRKCVDLRAMVLSGAFFSIFEDIFIILLPISELKGLKMSKRKRTALCAMFALGSVACVTSMIRLKYVWYYKVTIDDTWYNVDAVIWSDLEAYTAVICSCLMAIRPLLMKCFPVLFPSTRDSDTESGRGRYGSRQTWMTKAGPLWSGSSGSKNGTRSGLRLISTDSRVGHNSGVLGERASQESTNVLRGGREKKRSAEVIELDDAIWDRENAIGDGGPIRGG